MLRRARLVAVAARNPKPWALCLQQSLALCLWLARQGIQLELKIGVRQEGAELDAHAWVEYCGEVLNDSPHVSGQFAPLTGTNIGGAEARWDGERR